jgi:lipopolysaccharide transport system ATP-binding protein
MSDVILKVENVSKLYRLGTVGTGTFGGDVQRFWKTKILGQEDPFLKVGQINDRTSKEKADFVWALQDINFEVKRGEVVGIIGKNGAGKSTLLKLLSRITSPTTGSIKSAGRMASLLEVGTGFHPELTGRENIFLNGAILGMTKKEILNKFDEIVDFSGCELYIDTPTKRYSSGMTVRLGFAVAAFLDPEILIVDEVLAVGDAEFQKKAIGKMKEVSSGQGRTVLIVSHNMNSIKSLCQRGIIMENGKLKFNGPIEDALSNYMSIYENKVNLTLVERTNRQGNGQFKFTDVKLYDSFGNEIQYCCSFSYLRIDLHYNCDNHYIDNRQFICALNFQDNLGNSILSYISDEMAVSFNKFNKTGIISLVIQQLPLRGETYFLRLLAFNDNTEIQNAYDIIENVRTITVLPIDLHGVGRINRNGYASINDALFSN